jgi:hypothetical protein
MHAMRLMLPPKPTNLPPLYLDMVKVIGCHWETTHVLRQLFRIQCVYRRQRAK